MNIDKLITLTEDKRKSMDKEDIIEISGNRIKCRLCNSESGTLRSIFHIYTCKYSEIYGYGPYILGKRLFLKSKIDNSKSVGVLQREYISVNSNSSKTIVGTFGILSCVMLCMRNKKNNLTTLAHIDSLTKDYLNIFLQYESCINDTDVYIVGADETSKKLVNTILNYLKSKKFKLKFAYILSNRGNNFAINCLNGEFFMDDEINVDKDLPLCFEEKFRLQMLNIMPFCSKYLREVKKK